jgi:hypothetical protein
MGRQNIKNRGQFLNVTGKKVRGAHEGQDNLRHLLECGLIVIPTAGNLIRLEIIGGSVATESLFFASSETGLTTVLIITDLHLDFHLAAIRVCDS